MFALRHLLPLGLWLSMALLSGCVSIPAVIQAHSDYPQQDLVRVMNAPALYEGQEARFGGKVLQVVNRDSLTRLILAAQPLDSGARPILGSATIGRIYADYPGFIEPADVLNQYVTVIGTIKGTEVGHISEVTYPFLVIATNGYQRWHLSQQILTPPMPLYPWPGYGRRLGYFDPWLGPAYYPAPALTVQNYLSAE